MKSLLDSSSKDKVVGVNIVNYFDKEILKMNLKEAKQIESFKLGDHAKIIRVPKEIIGEGFIQCTGDTLSLVTVDIINKIWVSNDCLELVK